MLGQALPGIMPTHTFWRANMQSGVGINYLCSFITALPPCLSRRLTPRLSATLHVR